MASLALACPGSRATSLQLTNAFTTPAGIGHPANTGDCRIFLDALDASGNSLKQLALDPGESSEWFSAPEGAARLQRVPVLPQNAVTELPATESSKPTTSFHSPHP